MGVAHLPAAALAIIERDVLKGCTRVVLRSVSGPRIGKALAAALAAPAATQGSKGSSDPLASSCDAPKALNSVAGLTQIPEDTSVAPCEAGSSNQPTGGGV
jgi:hypothetical protein